MHHIKKHSFPPGLFDDVHQWARKWLKLGYKIESAKSKTVMKRMMAKYELFTGPPPKTIYRSLGDHLPPRQSDTGTLRRRSGTPLPTPKPQSMQPGISKKNLTPSLASVSLVNSVGASGGKKRTYLSQRSSKTGTISVLSVSSLMVPTLTTSEECV
jgi:hypothetical protein